MVSPIKAISGSGSRSVRGQRGFTYLMLLLWVVIAGVMLAALGTSWSLMARRERETELLWRGQQYQRALASYVRAGVAVQAAAAAQAQAYAPALPASAGASSSASQQSASPLIAGPRELQDLLEDRRSGKLVRHLRQLYPDPITGSPRWGVERSADGRITGIHSLSDAQPLRRSLGVETYRDLVFSSTATPPAALPASSGSVGPNGSRN